MKALGEGKVMNEMNELELKFIKSLANQYPDIASASTDH